jgi:hypothetical protein
MIRRLIRNAVRGTWRWLQEPERGPGVEHDFSKDTSPYPWLNSKFGEIGSDAICAQRPPYIWGTLHGAHMARALGIPRVSVIEFGVAGGNGLVALDRIGLRVEEICAVGIDVYGFDTGHGLPRPRDYRDSPNLYSEGLFSMDRHKLEARLTRARLILGLIRETVEEFIRSGPAPVAFVSVDLDYYSSTMEAFKLLEADHRVLLPRIHMYFDDIMGYTWSDFTGERLAIQEFDATHAMRKISRVYGLKWFVPRDQSEAIWLEQFYMAHIFDHPLIGSPDGLAKHWTDSLGNLSLRSE